MPIISGYYASVHGALSASYYFVSISQSKTDEIAAELLVTSAKTKLSR